MDAPAPSPLSVSLVGLPRARSPRVWIEWASGLRYRGVALDATAPGVRPRDLDRGGRRELTALLRRSELLLAGVDLFIPPEHFVDPRRVDRALAAVSAALGLVADLRGITTRAPTVTIELPAEADTVLDTLAEAALATGVGVADACFPLRELGVDGEAVIPALDPAAALLTGADPVEALAGAGPGAVALRLSDALAGARTPVGAGALNVGAYRVLTALGGAGRPIVTDLRGVSGWDAAARAAQAAWADAGDST